MRCFSPLCLLFILFWAGTSVQAAEALAVTDLIVPGKSVGLLKPGMSAEEIIRLYGEANVKMTNIPIAEGDTLEGAKLFAGTDRELDLIWKHGDPKKIISDVNVIGKAWIFSNGLKVGMTLVEVEKLNGKPFQISGFDWDYGGWVTDFQGGTLALGVGVRFTYGNRQIDEYLLGDKSLLSTDPKLRALNPTVDQPITVNLSLP